MFSIIGLLLFLNLGYLLVSAAPPAPRDLVKRVLPSPWTRTCGNNEIRFYNYNIQKTFPKRSMLVITQAAKERARIKMQYGHRQPDDEPTGGRFIYKGNKKRKATRPTPGIDIEMSDECGFPDYHLSYQDVLNTMDCILDFVERYARAGPDPVPIFDFNVRRPGAATPHIADGHFTKTDPADSVGTNGTDPTMLSPIGEEDPSGDNALHYDPTLSE